MAALTITKTDVAPLHDGVMEKQSGPAAGSIDAGQPVYYNGTNGRFTAAQADDAGTADVVGIAVTSANAAGVTITVLRQGLVDVGDALDGIDYGSKVYLSEDTAGVLDDAEPGTTSNIIVEVGTVVPVWGSTAGDKVLRVDIRHHGAVEA